MQLKWKTQMIYLCIALTQSVNNNSFQLTMTILIELCYIGIAHPLCDEPILNLWQIKNQIECERQLSLLYHQRQQSSLDR